MQRLPTNFSTNRSREQGNFLILGLFLTIVLIGIVSAQSALTMKNIQQADFYTTQAELNRYAESGAEMAYYDLRRNYTGSQGNLGTTAWSTADDLGQDSCAQHQGSAVCVPVSFLEPGFKPASCIDGSVLGDAPGVCLPSCLPAVQGLLTGLLLDQEGCPQNHLCAPCDHPITGNSTGACDL